GEVLRQEGERPGLVLDDEDRRLDPIRHLDPLPPWSAASWRVPRDEGRARLLSFLSVRGKTRSERGGPRGARAAAGGRRLSQSDADAGVGGRVAPSPSATVGAPSGAGVGASPAPLPAGGATAGAACSVPNPRSFSTP